MAVGASENAGYQLGFQLTPLTDAGELNLSGDFKGGPHPVDDDPLFKMASENRDVGNRFVQEGRYEEAIGRYSELIMQTRALENETDIQWTDASREQVRLLRAAAYLNLSLCFLKTKQWQHALNTATRAMQGDKDPVDPKEDVLPPEKKAKALFRRAQAHRDGFNRLDEALEDLKKATQFAPEDKAIQQELQRTSHAHGKVAKEADKKLAGFLAGNKKVQSGKGIFSDDLRPTNTDGPKLPTEPVKVSDGLWVVPDNEKVVAETAPGAEKLDVDWDELGREISELKEEKPEVFASLKDKVKEMLEQEMAGEKQDELEEEAEAPAAASSP